MLYSTVSPCVMPPYRRAQGHSQMQQASPNSCALRKAKSRRSNTTVSASRYNVSRNGESLNIRVQKGFDRVVGFDAEDFDRKLRVYGLERSARPIKSAFSRVITAPNDVNYPPFGHCYLLNPSMPSMTRNSGRKRRRCRSHIVTYAASMWRVNRAVSNSG